MFSGNKQVAVETPLLDGTETIAFQVSPDGSRLALVRRTDGHTELGMAKISRTADNIVVNGWRSIDTTQTNLPEIAAITDVAWVDDTTLLVLGTTSGNPVPALFRVSQDASSITLDTEPTTWDADALTVLLSDQTTVVVGRKGQTWKGAGGQWEPFVDRRPRRRLPRLSVSGPPPGRPRAPLPETVDLRHRHAGGDRPKSTVSPRGLAATGAVATLGR